MAPRPAASVEHTERLPQQVRRYEVNLVTLELTRDRLKSIRQRAQDASPAGLLPSPIIAYYSSLIDRYEVRLIKAQLLYQLALDRLKAS